MELLTVFALVYLCAGFVLVCADTYPELRAAMARELGAELVELEVKASTAGFTITREELSLMTRADMLVLSGRTHVLLDARAPQAGRLVHKAEVTRVERREGIVQLELLDGIDVMPDDK